MRNRTARPSMLPTRASALCIGRRKATTPAAVTSSQAATRANPTTTCGLPVARTARPRRYRLLALRVLDGDDRPGVVLESRHQRAGDVDRTQKDLAQGHQRVPSAATTTMAVTIIIARDSGNSDFHPRAISRS